jgi:hypothetical protein
MLARHLVKYLNVEPSDARWSIVLAYARSALNVCERATCALLDPENIDLAWHTMFQLFWPAKGIEADGRGAGCVYGTRL